MKLLSLTCPNCGANIEVNAELTKCTCNFCGKQFLIDDDYKRERKWNEQEGYDFEQGRIRAQNEEAERIRQEALRREAEAKQRQQEEAERLAQIWRNNKGVYWLAFFISAALSFAVFFYESIWPYTVLFFFGAATIVLFAISIIRATTTGHFHNHYSKSYWITAIFPGYVVGAIAHFIWFIAKG